MLNSKTLISAGWSGIVFVVVVLIGAFIAGTGPDPDATAAEVREFLADNRTALLWGVVLGLLATVPGVWFFAILAQAMRRATGDWVLSLALVIGALLVGSMAWAANAVTGALIWTDGFVDTASDELVLYGWNAAFMLYGASSIGFALFLGAAGWAVLRTQMMPAWVGWVGIVLAALALVGTFGSLDAGAGMLAFTGFLAFAVWIILAGITMITGKVTLPAGSEPRPSATPAA